MVKRIPGGLVRYKSSKIKQGYLSPSPSPLRIRQKGEKFELTKKLPVRSGDFSSAEEINIPLTKFEFDKLWKLVDRSLLKTRYLVPLDGGLTAELDVYDGKLKGLVVVEVEFASEDQMKSFIPPDWFGKDVTDEEFSANSFLAGRTFAEVVKKYLIPNPEV